MLNITNAETGRTELHHTNLLEVGRRYFVEYTNQYGSGYVSGRYLGTEVLLRPEFSIYLIFDRSGVRTAVEAREVHTIQETP